MGFDPALVLTFVEVAEAKSFTRAAAKLGALQPQVSLRIRKLESQLGFSLLKRNSRHVELTATGAQFLKYAYAIADAIRAGNEFAMSLAPQNDRLRVGTVDVAMQVPLRQKIVAAFLDRYSDVELDITTADSLSNYEKLAAGELDLLLLHTIGGFSPPGVDKFLIQRTIASLSMPADSPLARYNQIPIAALAGLHVIISPGKECPDLIDALQRQMEALGMTPHRGAEARRDTLLQMARKRNFDVLQWTPEDEPFAETTAPDMVTREIEGHPFIVDFCTMTAASRRCPTARRFVSLAAAIARESDRPQAESRDRRQRHALPA